MATKRKTRKSHPTWKDLKPSLADFDRSGLVGLLKDLYSFSKDNQAFLHARFGVGEDTLKPYKETISRWVCPDIPVQDYSVSKAKKAISDYRKAIGRAEGIAELTLFYCEECISFLNSCGLDDEGYYYSLESVFEQALKVIGTIEPKKQYQFIDRLEQICHASHGFGWGVPDYMDDLMSEYGFDNE